MAAADFLGTPQRFPFLAFVGFPGFLGGGADLARAGKLLDALAVGAGARVAALPFDPQLLGRKFPIGEVIQESGDEFLAPVLVIEVIGVLPDIAGEKRMPPGNYGRFAIGRGDPPKLTGIHNQPSPAAPETVHSRLDELLPESAEIAEITLNHLRHVAV